MSKTSKARNESFRRLMEKYGLSQGDTARLLRCSTSAVNRWVMGNRKCPAMAVELLAIKANADELAWRACDRCYCWYPSNLGPNGCPSCEGKKERKGK